MARPRLRPAPPRYRSNLIALATVAVALAAAPRAQAQGLPQYRDYYWHSGDGNFSDYWEDFTGQFVHPDWGWTTLYFGKDSDGNSGSKGGTVFNDEKYDLPVVGLGFYDHNWILDGKSLRMIDWENFLGAKSSNISVTVNASIRLDGVFGIKPHLSLEVSPNSTLTINGTIGGTGSLYKSDYGTAVLHGLHTYTEGTYLTAGRLVDFHPNGNYDTNAELEFQTAGDLAFGGSIAGGGGFTKSGYGTLDLTGSLGYTGATKIWEGRLIVQAPKSSSVNMSWGTVFETRLVQPTQTATYAGKITGEGTYVKSGAGRMTLSGQNDYTWGTEVLGGVLSDYNLHGDYALGDQTTLIAGENGASQVYGGVISGSGNFIKYGAGALTLSGLNTYTGTTFVVGGLLIDQRPHGTYRMDGGNLEFQTATDQTYAGGIFGNGTLTKSGAGTLTLSAKYDPAYPAFSGGTTVNGGRLIDLGPHGSYVTNAALEFRNANDLTYANVITGTGSFTKSGAGVLTLTAQNQYAGGTTVAEGTLREGRSYALRGSTDLEVKRGATLDLNGFIQAVRRLSGAGSVTLGGTSGALYAGIGNGSSDFDGTISGAGIFVKGGQGTLVRTGANTYTGGTTVSGGRLVDLNPHGDYVTDATLEFKTATDAAYGRTIDGTGTFVKSGLGTLSLSGGSIKGDVRTQIADGTLKVGNATVYGDVTGASRTTLQFDGSGRYDGAFSGDGALLKTGDGALTMAKAPTNAGGVRVAGGTLSVRGAGALSGGLTVDSGATLANLSGGVLSVGGRSLLQGTVQTAGGATSVFAGRVSGAGSFAGTGMVEFDGGYSPGNSPASVRFDGDLKLGSANALRMELGGAVLGTGYDHLTVNGTAFLGGALDVAYLNGFVASAGQSFDLFDFKRASGTFASLSLPTLSNGLVWNTSALYTTGVLRTQAVPEPASLAALGLGGLALLRRRRR